MGSCESRVELNGFCGCSRDYSGETCASVPVFMLNSIDPVVVVASVFWRFGSESRRCRWVGRGHVSIVFGRWQWRTGRRDIKDAAFEWVESMARGSFRFSRFYAHGPLRTTSIKVVSVVLSSLETHSKSVAVRLLSVFDLSLAADGVCESEVFYV